MKSAVAPAATLAVAGVGAPKAFGFAVPNLLIENGATFVAVAPTEVFFTPITKV